MGQTQPTVFLEIEFRMNEITVCVINGGLTIEYRWKR
jgi:hypothetical protein